MVFIEQGTKICIYDDCWTFKAFCGHGPVLCKTLPNSSVTQCWFRQFTFFFWVVNEARKTLLWGERTMFYITIGNIPAMYFLEFSEVALTVVRWALTTAPVET